MGELRPVRAISNTPVELFGDEHTPTSLFQYFTAYSLDQDKGWNFYAGDPELWHFSDRLIVPGGKVLDLGMGFGRTSMFFALQGMEVTAYETDPNPIRMVNTVAENYQLPITIHNEDILTADFGRNQYDAVMLGYAFQHFPNKKAAVEVLDRALAAVKPGGHIWVRAQGKDDASYLQFWMDANRYAEVRQLDEDTFVAGCECSGEWREEPFLYVEPTLIPEVIAKRGFSFVHTQVMPDPHHANIM